MIWEFIITLLYIHDFIYVHLFMVSNNFIVK